VLASLLVLTVSAVLVLAGTPGYAFPTADEDMSFSISSDIVVKDEDTFSVKLTMSESESVPVLSESVCDKGSPDSSNSSIKDLKVNFKSENGTRTCTMEGTGSITSSSKNVRHKGDEFIVQTLNFDDFPSGVSADVTQSVTFPGKVTEADGGTVEGTKVSFKDNDKHEVKGKDKPAKSAATGSSQDAEHSGKRRRERQRIAGADPAGLESERGERAHGDEDRPGARFHLPGPEAVVPGAAARLRGLRRLHASLTAQTPVSAHNPTW